MENAWEPMKNRNSFVVLERVSKVYGTISHMLGKKRKGPHPLDGVILDGKMATVIINNVKLKLCCSNCLRGEVLTQQNCKP